MEILLECGYESDINLNWDVILTTTIVQEGFKERGTHPIKR